MAAALDAIVAQGEASTSNTFSFNTTAAAASASMVIVVVTWYDTPTLRTLDSVSSPDGSFTRRAQRTQLIGGNTIATEIWSRAHTSGLASGSTITVTYSGTLTGRPSYVAISFTGITAYDTNAVNSGTTSTALSTGAATNTNADAVFVGGIGAYATTTRDVTPGTDIVEDVDRYDSTSLAKCTWVAHQIVTSSASRDINGTLSSAGTAWAACLAVFTAEASTPPQTIRPDGDLATTGWATAPLYSKVNDSSDATVITATLA